MTWNRLAGNLTTWRWWYVLPMLVLLPVASGVATLVGILSGGGAGALAWTGPLTFLLLAAFGLIAVRLMSRRWPTSADLGLRSGLSRRDIVVVLAVFVVSHALYWVLGKAGSGSELTGAEKLFADSGLTGPLPAVLATVIASVILAPVVEELVYRGIILRILHDSLIARLSSAVAASIAVVVSALAFALPHLGGSPTGIDALAYILTGVFFGVAYVLTGSLTATMVSHSLQSMAAFGQILIFGRGDADVSPIVWILVFGCPVWVYLCARGLAALLPGRD